MSTGEWLLTMKPSFLAEWSTLQSKEAGQIAKKLELLAHDPRPDAKTKKQLKSWDGKLHRLRSGDFRVFYTFESPHVSLLALRRRAEDTYDDEVEGELLGGGEAVPSQPSDGRAATTWERWLVPAKEASRRPAPLGSPITTELLERLRVEPRWHDRLVSIATEDELLDADDVPEAVRLQVVDALVGRPLEQVRELPDLRLEEPEDLLRYREGGLLAFLLKLDPDQEKLVPWASGGAGPTLLKGGPGTGKSTVALYRVRVMLERLRAGGVPTPRLLYTTYTNALVRFSEQLLASLLGRDARLVDVRTADSVAIELARELGLRTEVMQPEVLDELLARALSTARFEGNSLVQAAQRRTLDKLGHVYLREELLGVIAARGLRTLEEYQRAARPGRRVALGRNQREGIWRVWEAFSTLLATRGEATWETIRIAVDDGLRAGRIAARYDGVVIDEAQDLSPVAIRVLVRACTRPGALFLTADANQSIYGAGFRWTDVHESLRFQGRTAILRANHRSTREIGEAAESFLAEGRLDPDVPPALYVHSGPLPAVRRVGSERDEARLLALFFRSAARELRMGPGACAVLCPTNEGARRIAAALTEQGLNATFVRPKELDISAPGAKVLTLKSAKGLEFPVVAVAGFLDGAYPFVLAGADEEQRAEHLDRERRTLFVAFTRAMRALLVVAPADAGRSPLLTTFDAQRWNLGAQ